MTKEKNPIWQKTIRWIFLISGVILFAWLMYNLSYKSQKMSCFDSNEVETVMSEDMQIETNIDGKSLAISAGPCYERTYTWDGNECTILHQARNKRWYGSLGIYSPSRSDWKPGSCKGIDHAVVEEGQQHFETLSEANDWVSKYHKNQELKAHTDDGLLVSWEISSGIKNQALLVEVWQIYVNGEKPTKLDGSQNDKIRVKYK